MKSSWQTKKLADVCELIKDKPQKFLGQKRYYTTRGINNEGDYKYDIVTYKSRPGRANLYPRIGDVGFAKMKGTNKVFIVSKALQGCIFSTGFAILRAKNNLLPEYLYLYISSDSFQQRKDYFAGVGIMGGIKKVDIENIEISFPTLAEQKRIVKILDEAFDQIVRAKTNTENNLQNSRALFESYLQGIFVRLGKNWEERKIGDKHLLKIIDSDRGKNYPRKTDFFKKGFCLFMNTKNVRPDGFDFKTVMFVTEQKDKALGGGKLRRNDIVMTTRGTIGNLGLYNDEVKYDNIRINSGMLIFRPNPKIILPEYLFEILRSGIVKTQIKKHVSGAAQPQLPIKTLTNFTIPLPKSLAEQEAIVRKLDVLEKTTKKMEEIYLQKREDFEELKKSLLKKAFEGEL